MKQALEGQTKAQWQPDFMDNFVVGEGIVYLVIWLEKSIVEVTHENGLQKGKNKNAKKKNVTWQVKLLIKLAAAKASGEGHGSQVLSDLIGELKEADITTELRFKIDQSHPDIGAGYLSQPAMHLSK